MSESDDIIIGVGIVVGIVLFFVGIILLILSQTTDVFKNNNKLNNKSNKPIIFDNDELRIAVKLFNQDRNKALNKYGDPNTWDVSNVTNMNSLFRDSEFNGDISNWDVSNVGIMLSMFKNSKFNGDISNWDVSNVVLMNEMFYNSEFNRDISNWKINCNCDMTDMYKKTIIEAHNKAFKPNDCLNK